METGRQKAKEIIVLRGKFRLVENDLNVTDVLRCSETKTQNVLTPSIPEI